MNYSPYISKKFTFFFCSGGIKSANQESCHDVHSHNASSELLRVCFCYRGRVSRRERLVKSYTREFAWLSLWTRDIPFSPVPLSTLDIVIFFSPTGPLVPGFLKCESAWTSQWRVGLMSGTIVVVLNHPLHTAVRSGKKGVTKSKVHNSVGAWSTPREVRGLRTCQRSSCFISKLSP